jgi:hypothetical protein
LTFRRFSKVQLSGFDPPIDRAQPYTSRRRCFFGRDHPDLSPAFLAPEQDGAASVSEQQKPFDFDRDFGSPLFTHRLLIALNH